MTRTGSSANTPGGMAFNLLLFRYLEDRKIISNATIFCMHSNLASAYSIANKRSVSKAPHSGRSISKALQCFGNLYAYNKVLFERSLPTLWKHFPIGKKALAPQMYIRKNVPKFGITFKTIVYI